MFDEESSEIEYWGDVEDFIEEMKYENEYSYNEEIYEEEDVYEYNR